MPPEGPPRSPRSRSGPARSGPARVGGAIRTGAALALAGLRLASTLLTIIPLPQPRPRLSPAESPGQPHPTGPAAPDRATAGAAMCWAPVVGLLLGAGAAGVHWLAGRAAHTGPVLAAALAIAFLAVATGGLHLDGLADLADGLGSRRPAGDALEIMKRSDTGPMGVASLVLVLLIQVAALGAAVTAGRGFVAVAAAAVTARLAITACCVRGIRPARPAGLGALVAGSVHPLAAAALILAAVAAAAPFGTIFVVAIAVGLAVAGALAALAIRALGGITGDVLGGIAELAAAACLVVTALR
jgi:adenosylcobinamide-GDP ribazoletransferase